MTSLAAAADGVDVIDAQTVAVARQVLATHAKSFRFAGLFLPAHRLDDAAVVYAFCRLVDDAIDEAPDSDQARREAAALAAELTGTAPARPEVRAFLAVARRLDLDVAFARHLVEGVAFDANERVRVADDAGLLRYCYLVAGTVGGMMCAVLGVKATEALPYAVDLGIGMQITNISRDVREDAHKDRAYVPASRLRSVGVNAATFVEDVVADRYYASADAGMRFIPWRSRLAILVAGRVYRAIGRKLLRTRRGDALQGRVSTTMLEKVGQVLVAGGRFFALLYAAPRPHDASLHGALRGLPGTAPPGDTWGAGA